LTDVLAVDGSRYRVDPAVVVTQTCTPLTLAAESCIRSLLELFHGPDEIQYLQENCFHYLGQESKLADYIFRRELHRY
jgi:hypothetical protein